MKLYNPATVSSKYVRIKMLMNRSISKRVPGMCEYIALVLISSMQSDIILDLHVNHFGYD